MSASMKSKRKKPNVIIYTKKKTYRLRVSESALKIVALKLIELAVGETIERINKKVEHGKA